MEIRTDPRNIDYLRSLSLFGELDIWQLQAVSDAVEPVAARKGQSLLERGSDDGYTYFLVDGQVALEAADGRKRKIQATPEVRRTPLANLRPRLFQVRALSKIEGFRIPDIVLRAAGATDGSHSNTLDTILVEDSDQSDRRELESELGFRLYKDLKEDKSILPTLPDLAVRIRKAIKDGTSDAKEIARIVETDPAITAKLVKVANSALYGGRATIESCPAAIVRLGTKTTQKLVLTYSLQEVFKTSIWAVNERMQALWNHCADVASISFILARLTKKFDPEEAMLAGLVHDVGTIAILNYTEVMPQLADDPEALENSIGRLRGELGAMILREWSFPTEVVLAAREAENWKREHDEPADFADLIVVAQLHDQIGEMANAGLPPFHEIGAVKRLLGEDVTPETSIGVLQAAQAQITETRFLLG